MSDPEEGTTDFRVGGLKDLLDEEERGTDAKGAGAQKNKQLALIGGVAALIVVILGLVLLGGGGGGDDTAADEGTTVPVNLRGDKIPASVKKGDRVSICATKPLAENVLVVERRAKESFGTEVVTLDVSVADPKAATALTSNNDSKSFVVESETCP